MVATPYQDIKAEFRYLLYLYLWNSAVAGDVLFQQCVTLPPQLGSKGADSQEISDTNLPLLVNQSFLVQDQNYKLALPKLTTRQV